MYGFSNEAWAFIKIDRFFMTYFDQSHDSLEGKAEEYEEYSNVSDFNRCRGRNYDSIEELKDILPSGIDEALAYITPSGTILAYTYL